MHIEEGPEIIEKSVYTKWVEAQEIPVIRGFCVDDVRTAIKSNTKPRIPRSKRCSGTL